MMSYTRSGLLIWSVHHHLGSLDQLSLWLIDWLAPFWISVHGVSSSVRVVSTGYVNTVSFQKVMFRDVMGEGSCWRERGRLVLWDVLGDVVEVFLGSDISRKGVKALFQFEQFGFDQWCESQTQPMCHSSWHTHTHMGSGELPPAPPPPHCLAGWGNGYPAGSKKTVE